MNIPNGPANRNSVAIAVDSKTQEPPMNPNVPPTNSENQRRSPSAMSSIENSMISSKSRSTRSFSFSKQGPVTSDPAENQNAKLCLLICLAFVLVMGILMAVAMFASGRNSTHHKNRISTTNGQGVPPHPSTTSNRRSPQGPSSDRSRNGMKPFRSHPDSHLGKRHRRNLQRIRSKSEGTSYSQRYESSASIDEHSDIIVPATVVSPPEKHTDFYDSHLTHQESVSEEDSIPVQIQTVEQYREITHIDDTSIDDHIETEKKPARNQAKDC